MNAFRHLLKTSGHHPPVGTWIMSGSPIVAEALGHAGFDWGLLDMEHSPLDVMEIVQLLQALSSTKMTPVVRVPSHDAVLVKRVLDAGATTLMFPFVQSAEDARRVVASTRYAPEGVRGVSPMSRASHYGTSFNYLRTANQQMGVIVQLETVHAVDHLEEIAAVRGVDALFIGPSDLSAHMGHLGDLQHPEVMDVMAEAAMRARAVGKPIGALGHVPEAVAQYRAAGFDFLAVASDLGLLMRGARAVVDSLRTQDVSSHVHSLLGGTQTEPAA